MTKDDKTFIVGQMKALRDDLRGEMKAMGNDLRGEMKGVETRLTVRINGLDEEVRHNGVSMEDLKSCMLSIAESSTDNFRRIGALEKDMEVVKGRLQMV